MAWWAARIVMAAGLGVFGCGRCDYELGEGGARRDAGVDGGARIDAGIDGGDRFDASLDGGSDAGVSGLDASGGSDAGPDAGPSSGPLMRTVASFSTASSTFVAVPGADLTLDVSPAGQPWIVWVSATLASTIPVTELSVEAQYTVNGVARGHGGAQTMLPATGGSFVHFVAIDTSAGPRRFELWLREVAGGTATIDQLRIVAFPVPPGADVHYGEMNDPLALPGTSVWTTHHTLALTPSAPGEYVLLGAVSSSEFPSTAADVRVRWVDPLGTMFPESPRYLNVRQAWQTFTMVQTVVLPDTAPRTLELQAHSRGTGSIRSSHILAMRVDAFASVAGVVYDGALVSVPSGTTAVLTEHATPAALGGTHVVLQSARIDHVSCGAEVFVREGRFEIDSRAVTTIAHAIDNCAYEPAYGAVTLLRTDAPFTARNVVAPTMGETLEVGASYVYVLRL